MANRYEEHLAYLHDIVRLKLWFLWNWARVRPEEDFIEGLRHRVDLRRKTAACANDYPADTDFDHPGWQALEDDAQALFQRHRGDPDADAFEQAAFNLFRPSIDAYSHIHYLLPVAEGFQCGSLKFDPPMRESPRRVTYHIANAVQPRSLFTDRRYLPRCFMELMDQGEAEYGATELITGTWLNSHPRWQALFPPQYHANMAPAGPEIGATANHWGQFINARGTFHAPRAAQFRETRTLPFPSRTAWCSFAALRAHLKTYA